MTSGYEHIICKTIKTKDDNITTKKCFTYLKPPQSIEKEVFYNVLLVEWIKLHVLLLCCLMLHDCSHEESGLNQASICLIEQEFMDRLHYCSQ